METPNETSAQASHALDAPDEAVWDDLRREDVRQAVGRLVQAYQHKIVRYCAHLLAESTLAEDLAQEVFVTAYVQLEKGKFRGEASFQTWLYGIARHKCWQAQRNRRLRERLRHAHATTIGEAVHRQQRDALSAASETCVQDAFRRLQRKQRDLLMRLYVDHLPMEEVAKGFWVGRRTITRRSQEAKQDFRTFYERCMHGATSTA